MLHQRGHILSPRVPGDRRWYEYRPASRGRDGPSAQTRWGDPGQAGSMLGVGDRPSWNADSPEGAADPDGSAGDGTADIRQVDRGSRDGVKEKSPVPSVAPSVRQETSAPACCGPTLRMASFGRLIIWSHLRREFEKDVAPTRAGRNRRRSAPSPDRMPSLSNDRTALSQVKHLSIAESYKYPLRDVNCCARNPRADASNRHERLSGGDGFPRTRPEDRLRHPGGTIRMKGASQTLLARWTRVEGNPPEVGTDHEVA